MDTEFKPRKELFRPCCGHCIFGMKRKSTDKLGMRKTIFKCKKNDKLHSYGHICDITSTDDGVQLSMFSNATIDATAPVPTENEMATDTLLLRMEADD